MRSTLVLAAAIAALGCGQKVSLGSAPGAQDDGSGTTGAGGGCATIDCMPPYDPCAGLHCGDLCDPCDPSTGQTCTAPPGLFYCDPLIGCTDAPLTCACTFADPGCPANACSGVACGTPCACDPGDPTCDATIPSVCDASGVCLDQTLAKCDPCSDPGIGLVKQCGEPCDLYCMPWDEPCMAAKPMELNVCNGLGDCKPPESAQCSPSFAPCAGKECGDFCAVCDTVNDPNCYKSQVLFCNGAGASATCSEFVACPEEDCDLAPCGAQCKKCAANDLACDPKFCDGAGTCTYADSIQCGVYYPCADEVCGTPCQLCDSSTMTCRYQDVFLVCGADGGPCTDLPACGYAPCAGKICGADCTICAPADMTCMEPDPTTPKYCDLGGQCTISPASCM